MSDLQTRVDTLARRLQAIIAVASGPRAPITQLEAYDQIVEELELAGYGAPLTRPDLSSADRAELRRQSAH